MRQLLLAASILCFAIPAYALPGEAAAVIRHCGEPHAENFTTSPITGKAQRDLIYKMLTLHFEPQESGWSFTTAWEGHLPVTRSELDARLPCFHAALAEVAAVPLPVIDPTIAQQTTTPAAMSPSSFGVPHFWLLVALVLLTLMLVFLPRRRRSVIVQAFRPGMRHIRKPLLAGKLRRRRTDSPSS